jgi:hypothetical protein
MIARRIADNLHRSRIGARSLTLANADALTLLATRSGDHVADFGGPEIHSGAGRSQCLASAVNG